MKKAKKLLALLLAMTIVMSGVVINTDPTLVNAADPMGVRATVYSIPGYVHDGILEEDGWGATTTLKGNDQFDETIDALLAASYEIGVRKPGITAFPYINVEDASNDDYYIREWKGTMTVKKSGTYTMLGQAIDNGFAMRIKPHGAPDDQYKTVYEYWGASHWFPQYPILGPVPYPDSFTAEAGDVFDVEMYYMDLDYGEVLEMTAQCDYAEGNPATIKLYDDPIYETEASREANRKLREETFAFDLTERIYDDIADPDHINKLIGLGTASEGTKKGGDGAQCIEENFKFHESIDTLLSLATKGETYNEISFATSLNNFDCPHCNYDGDCYVILYEGTLKPDSTGWYRFGAYNVDNGFYMEIDPDPVGATDTQDYQTVYELWAGNIRNIDGSGNVYPTGIKLQKNKTYRFRAAFLKTEGSSNAEIVAYWNSKADNIAGIVPVPVNYMFELRATNVENAGDDFPFTTPTEEEAVAAPKLAETKNDILYYADFLDEKTFDKVKVQQIPNLIDLPDPENDPEVTALRDEDGYMLMAEHQYINLGLDMLKGRSNVTIEFVVKPALLNQDHIAFAGIGDADEENPNWVVMGYHADGSVKFGMNTTGTEVGEFKRSDADKLAEGRWATVKYEFTASTVKVYVDDSLVYQYNVTSQKSLGQMVDGDFIFGKVLRFNNPGFEGSIAEIRVSSSKALEKTEKQVLFYTDFTNETVKDMIVKEATADLPNLKTDEEVDAIERDEDGHMVMSKDQYIDLDFDLLKGKDNAIIEFVVKPSALSDMAFAGIGSADTWATMDMTASGAVQYGMQTGGAKADSAVSTAGLLAEDQWSVVKYAIDKENIEIYVNGELVQTVAVTDGNTLDQILDGALIFGKELKDGTAGFEGLVSEVRVTTMPVLNDVEGEVLFYTDFSDTNNLIIKEAVGEEEKIIPDIADDPVVNATVNEDGHLVMTEQQYIDIGLDELEGKNNISLEFVIKPSIITDHRALAGIGSSAERNWIIMGMRKSGAMKFAMETNMLGRVGEDDYNDQFGLLIGGKWTKVRYDITAFKVSVYVDDVFVKSWNTTGQRTLSEITEGSFIFGKEVQFGDPGFAGEISELRVSSFKALPETDKQVLVYTDFTDLSNLDVKEVGDSGVPSVTTDKDAAANFDEHGHLFMDGTQYVSLDFDALKDKPNATVEFLVKPTAISESTFVALGTAESGITMGMTADGRVTLQTVGTATTEAVTSVAGVLKQNEWASVKYEIEETTNGITVVIFVNDVQVASGVVTENTLASITDGEFIFGEALHTADSNYNGYVSEIRAFTMPTLGETDMEVLYYTDFSADSDEAVVKESAKDLPNTTTDSVVDATLTEEGFLSMTAQQYIDIGLDELEGNDRILMEFIIKPEAIVDHAAFAGIGNTQNWLVMGMRGYNALKFGMQSNGKGEAGKDQENTTTGLLQVGEWALVQYEFTTTKVSAYMNGELIYTWDITGQYSLSQFTKGDFVFGKELRFGNAGYEGLVSEIRVSTFKSLDETDKLVLFYTNFEDTEDLVVKEATNALPEPDTDSVVEPEVNDYGHLVLNGSQYIDFGLDTVDVTDNAMVEFLVKPSEIRESAITGLGNSEKWVSIGLDENGHVTYSINVGGETISGASTEAQFVKDYWTLVQYEITATGIKIYIEGTLAVAVPFTDGSALQEITEGGVILGKELKFGTAGFVGSISELRISAMPTLEELDDGETELFYTDFSDLSKLTVKRSYGVPNPTTDFNSAVILDEDGYMKMSANQYINLGLDLLKDKDNVTIEFVVKPEVAVVHNALAGIGGGEDNWLVMGIGEESSLKFGMDTLTTSEEVCKGEYTPANSFAVGKWVKVRYEFTPTTVTAYINDVQAQVWNITGQKSLSEFTNGSFLFGMETKFGDPGFQGTVAEVRVTTTDTELFDISFASMTMANSLDMNFAFEAGLESDWTDYYAVITKNYADGTAAVTQTIPYEEWNSTMINGIEHYYVTFTGIAAKEMTDDIYVTIYNAEGVAVSDVWKDSVRDQAMRNLEKLEASTDSKAEYEKTMVVDMLNYGAAAQTYFKYKEEDLATAKLSETQKKYATENATYENTAVKGPNYYGANVLLESNIQFMMAFTNIDKATKAEIAFTDHYGNDKKITIESSKFKKDGNYYIITIEEMVVADARQVITCTVYGNDGKTVVASATDSIESYVARITQKENAELYEMIIKFSDSANAYLHAK